MKKLILISIILLVLLAMAFYIDSTLQMNKVKLLTARARGLEIGLSQSNNIPSRSFCESSEYRLLQANYLSLSIDLDNLDDRWISARKTILQNLVDGIKESLDELSVECSR
jgi:hypothetical protein